MVDQENQWLFIIYTLQMVIIFEGRRVNSFFEGKTHQIQLNNTPKLQFFLNHQPPNQPESFTTNYNLHYIFCLSIFNYFLFFLIVTFKFSCTCYLLNTLKQSKNASAKLKKCFLVCVGNNKYCWRYDFFILIL